MNNNSDKGGKKTPPEELGNTDKKMIKPTGEEDSDVQREEDVVRQFVQWAVQAGPQGPSSFEDNDSYDSDGSLGSCEIIAVQYEDDAHADGDEDDDPEAIRAHLSIMLIPFKTQGVPDPEPDSDDL